MSDSETATADVFWAAEWLDDLWNSRARAVGPDRIEWECRTWGSGRGRGAWEETALFRVVAARFDLRNWSNRDERDELVVEVLLHQFNAIARIVEQLDVEAESWPWMDEEDEDLRIAKAAEALGLKPEELLANGWLLEEGRIGEP